MRQYQLLLSKVVDEVSAVELDLPTVRTGTTAMSESKKTSDLPYRPCVGILLLNHEQKVFVGCRIDQRAEAWQMPQGGIDAGEDPEDAAFRELEEEIGTRQAEIIAVSPGWITYDLPEELVGKVWKGRYRGQKQKWFAMRFLGTDADINLEAHHPEFSEWKWVSMNALPDLIVPFKRQSYVEVVDCFAHLLSEGPD